MDVMKELRDDREEPTLEKVKEALTRLAPFPDEIEAVGLLGSIIREDFNRFSDIDVFIVYSHPWEKEHVWRDKIKGSLEIFRGDKNILEYDIRGIIKIATWYVFEMASDSVLVYDKGRVKKIFDKIVDKAVKQWDLVRERYGRHWCWGLGRPARPGERLRFELTGDDLASIGL